MATLTPGNQSNVEAYWTDSLEERRFLEAVRNGSAEAAFELLYATYYPTIYRYFGRRLTWIVAEDKAQETFVIALTKLREGELVDRPLGWLCTISNYLLLRHIEIEANRNRLRHENEMNVGASFGRSFDGAGHDINEDAPSFEARATIENWYRGLEPTDQSIVEFYLDNFSLRDIAQAVNLNHPEQVKRRLHAALARLEEMLANAGITSE